MVDNYVDVITCFHNIITCLKVTTHPCVNNKSITLNKVDALKKVDDKFIACILYIFDWINKAISLYASVNMVKIKYNTKRFWAADVFGEQILKQSIVSCV